ncbi:MAG: prepilin-type N-terminal cleavage/methylation domain-containing protein [Patescibacteria group bacterium]
MISATKIKTQPAGFTLIELIIVLSIILILTAISLPVYSSIQPNLDLNASIRQTTSDLRLAQQLAVTEQINYSVIFDVVDNSYSIVNTKTNYIVKSYNINRNVRIESITGLASSTATFNATGASLESGTIVLANSNNRQSTIEIKPSGYVKNTN